ncbi:MAG: hypothetical protein M1839_002609 [Geoglossum umbratile]|nr:MAG: hypothetical protein M1839_002609 [Geoglossum umbratile]
MSRATVRRNVHFLDGENNEVLGFWQNGSVVWDQVTGWMHITITLPSMQYVVFRCLESGQDPATNHGPSTNLLDNNDIVNLGYYVVLSANGEPLDIAVTKERAIPRSVSYNLSNPDPRDNYKVICFVPDPFGFDGNYMFQSNYPQHYQPLRSLLKYHFRMAVLCNMKATGPEYDWDENIPPGMDPVVEVSNSEKGKLRFEPIMAERLNSLVE